MRGRGAGGRREASGGRSSRPSRQTEMIRDRDYPRSRFSEIEIVRYQDSPRSVEINHEIETKPPTKPPMRETDETAAMKPLDAQKTLAYVAYEKCI